MPRIAAVLHLMLIGVPLAAAAQAVPVKKSRFEVWWGGSLAGPWASLPCTWAGTARPRAALGRPSG